MVEQLLCVDSGPRVDILIGFRTKSMYRTSFIPKSVWSHSACFEESERFPESWIPLLPPEGSPFNKGQLKITFQLELGKADERGTQEGGSTMGGTMGECGGNHELRLLGIFCI